jgi:hypothetical protein
MMKQEIMVNTEKFSMNLDNIFKFSVDYNDDRIVFSYHMVSEWKNGLHI